MNNLKRFAFILLGVGLAGSVAAQKKKNPANDFKTLPSGIQYKIVKKGNGTRKAVVGDHVEMFIHVSVGDSVAFDSRKMYNATEPVPVTIRPSQGNGDLMEGFMLLSAGDSALFHIPVDTLLKGGQPAMPGMKQGVGQMMKYEVNVVAVRSEEEQRRADSTMAAEQIGKDEQLLKDYFKKNNIKATRTASGLYYTISQQATGANIAPGQMASVNYTGRLLNGNVFDSNTDSAYKHVEPFNLTVGKGQVIKGWDEGLQLMGKGTKGTLYIPSGLAYGRQDRSPQIPANSILVFDMEIVDVTDQASQDDKLIQEYLKQNNITNAIKTPSGLYYTISQKGLGGNPTKGKKVTMNYTGKLLNGNVFDSNTDPKFGHVKPFEFTLGMGQVIKGWDEGVALLQIGSKGTFFIPSGLGYGPNAMGAKIPANSVLLFDVELVGID